jgi:alpha-D-xyloside xylohydrolase
MKRFAFTSLPLLVLTIGCTEPAPPVDEGLPNASLASPNATLDVVSTDDTIVLKYQNDAILTLPANAFVLGTVDELTDSFNYDPAPILMKASGAKEPDGLTFTRGKSFVITKNSEKEITIVVTHEGDRQSRVTLSMDADGRFRGFLAPVDATNVAYLGLAPKTSADEGFYGLGEWFDHVNHRGQKRAMQLELDSSLESGYNEAHVPIPFVIGTRGWGLFVENLYPALFEVATENPESIVATFGTGLASAQGLTFHLFAATAPIDVTRHYYDVTGYPKLPARWGLGPTVWRDENLDQNQFENDLKAMRDLDLPTSAVWIDRPYASAVNTFDFNPAQFTNAQAMIDLAHELGFRMSLWHTPYLDEKTMPTPPAITPLLQEATAKGFYPTQRGILLNKWGSPIDFTNPEAFAWWQNNIKKYTSMGIEGFKLDYGEDVVPGVFGARNVWIFSDGSDERTMHAEFPILYHRVYAELFPDEGSFLLCRAGTYGDQKNVTVIWPGDLDASFAKHREEVNEKGEQYVAVGGLPAALIAGLSLGPSGYPFYGSDTGGYRHSPPDKELFTRWFQITALSPVMQIGTSTNDVAWEGTPQNGFDAEMLDWYREYTRLHLRLFPYTWTYAKQIAMDGRPIQRPLGLAHPEMGIHPDDVFLLGDHLLVAPIVERAATKRDVPFPNGRWMNWWTGEIVMGGQTTSVNAPLDTLPLFLTEGGIVPMLRPSIDSLSPTTKPGTMAGEVDSYATNPGILWARIFPGPTSTFNLFDGATIGQTDEGATFTLTTTGGSEFKDGVLFEVIGVGALPKGVELGGVALTQSPDVPTLANSNQGFAFSPERNGTLWIRVPTGSQSVRVTR